MSAPLLAAANGTTINPRLHVFNCSTNVTAVQDPDTLQANVIVTAVFASVSWVCTLVYIVQNICGRTHNQWPHSQVQWLAYSVLLFDTIILIGGFWGFVASTIPYEVCMTQSILVQFVSCTIFGWFMVCLLYTSPSPRDRG